MCIGNYIDAIRDFPVISFFHKCEPRFNVYGEHKGPWRFIIYKVNNILDLLVSMSIFTEFCQKEIRSIYGNIY